jgi:hypothetical protein
VRIPTPKKIPPSLKEYSVGQLSKDYLPIITTTTTTTTTYTHLILATLSFYFWPMPNFFCRMPNFMRPDVWSLFPTELVTKVKPNINSVEVHPQLRNNGHPVG